METSESGPFREISSSLLGEESEDEEASSEEEERSDEVVTAVSIVPLPAYCGSLCRDQLGPRSLEDEVEPDSARSALLALVLLLWWGWLLLLPTPLKRMEEVTAEGPGKRGEGKPKMPDRCVRERHFSRSRARRFSFTS